MMRFVPTIALLAFLSLIYPLSAASRIFPVPPELRTDRFSMTINGQPAFISHAATTYYFANFELQGSARISITAPSDDYWGRGVEIQPWRWGIRPLRQGRTISFTVSQPMKLSISRPGNHGAGAEMLFLFANAPEADAPQPGQAGIRYFAPGVYHQNIDAQNGDTIYLAPGAVVFGAINIWGTHDVRILGRGTVVYDGPQNPNADEGWQHKPNWHVIGMDHAHGVEISGITCLVRSRTWMIQMLASRNIKFMNVKVIGGCPGNANQDGIDWLGGGDTLIQDCFFRASDDIFALYGNWLGYGPEEITTPGEDVENIRIENSVLSTSISNIVRVSWPQKVFNSRNFIMRDTDIIHMGSGGCKIPFALLEIWDDPGGRGQHENYRFENIRLEEWYSLTQLRKPNPAIRDVSLKDTWPLETPALVPSVIDGKVFGVELPAGGGQQPGFTYSEGELKPGEPVDFRVVNATPEDGNSYQWTFGDGATASGFEVQHAFPDTQGTLLDGSGRFRVLLKITDTATGSVRWSGRSIVVAKTYHEPAADPGPQPLDAKAAGGFTFFLVSNDGGRLEIDGETIATSPAPKPQVCGSIGNMAQLALGTIGLKAGKHALRVTDSHTTGPNDFAVYWQGPGVPMTKIPVTPLAPR